MELSYSGKSESRAYGSCVCFKRGVSKLASDTPSFCLCAIFNIIMSLFHYIFTTLSIIAEKRIDYSKKQIEPCGFQNHRI